MVSERIALYRRQRARYVARRRCRHQPRIAGRGRDCEFTSGKIKSRTGIGGRLGAGAEASRMADTLDSGDADVHSSPGRNRTRVQEWRFTSNFTEALSMVSGVAFASCALYRHRAATRTHSFACSRMTRPSCKARCCLEHPEGILQYVRIPAVATSLPGG